MRLTGPAFAGPVRNMDAARIELASAEVVRGSLRFSRRFSLASEIPLPAGDPLKPVPLISLASRDSPAG